MSTHSEREGRNIADAQDDKRTLAFDDCAVLNEAARALERGDALSALNLVGRESSALARLLRGIAYAQLGDLDLANDSLARAALDGDALVAARARAALVEVALRIGEPKAALRSARESARELALLGDLQNAALQRLMVARAELLLGQLAEARHTLASVGELPEEIAAIGWLARAEVAIRAVAAAEAAEALERARAALQRHPHVTLARELAALERELSLPLSRITRQNVERDADLFDIEQVSRGDVLLVDACRLLAIAGRVTIPLARRPVLFALLDQLARAWPQAVTRDLLAQRAFGVRRVNDSHRARLRVEVGRLRTAIADLAANPEATKEGYALRSAREVVSLSPMTDDEGARLTVLLGDGAAWTAQSLGEHAGVSKRTAQRALADLLERGQAVRIGAGRDVRYVRPGTPLASRMLLLSLLPKLEL